MTVEKKEPQQEFLSAEELAKQADQQSVAVFNQTSAGLEGLRKAYDKKKIPDATTKEGFEVIKKANKALTTTRTALKAAKDEIKKPYLNVTRKVDAEFKRVTGEIEKIEAPWKQAYQDEKNRAEKEKQERIDRLQKKVDAIIAYQAKARGLSSDQIAGLLTEVEQIDAENEFYDLTAEAVKAKQETVEFLDRAFDERLQWEQNELERKQLEAEKAALEAEQRVNNAIAAYSALVGNHMDSDRATLVNEISKIETFKLPHYGDRTNEVVAAQEKAYLGLKKLLAMLPEEEPAPEAEQFGNPGEHIRAEEAASFDPAKPGSECVAIGGARIVSARVLSDEEAEEVMKPSPLIGKPLAERFPLIGGHLSLSLMVDPAVAEKVVSLLMDQFEVVDMGGAFKVR